jgi:hypothetical protein
MLRVFVSIAVLILLALTVPWWFAGAPASEREGLPVWVLYVLSMNLVFPVAVAWLLARFWERFEGDESSGL